ncbi:MAG TPA: SDR family oxidoreductase [Planctomycetota bacterium]|nr:SDR family oxidoreductase [Planctomycetota bacterium]HPF13473.1 SDR family oxidoreductase [Planctomycetota bacterium]HRV80325.1 SDR family oxidoreductase [Planctomycetota bacterium]
MQRQALIVGASTGIGHQLAQLLGERGYAVTSASRSQGGLDVTEEQPAFPEIDGPIHALAFCPGTILLKPFAQLKDADFRHDLEVNFLGAVKTLRHYQRHLMAADGASVVLFSTVAVQAGMAFHASVASAKGAVEGLTRSLAAEWAPKVRVNALAPSLTDTPLAARLVKTEAQREGIAKRHSLGRIGTPLDVAEAAAFLLGTQSNWITGQVLPVDGGMANLRTP